MKCPVLPPKGLNGRVSPPSRGAWIEMGLYLLRAGISQSPPSRGAWIEMLLPSR